MSIYNGKGKALKDSALFNGIFNAGSVQLIDFFASEDSTFDFPVEIGETYVLNPFNMIYNFGHMYLLDADKNELYHSNSFHRNAGVAVLTTRSVKITEYLSADDAREGKESESLEVSTDSDIAYIRFSNLRFPTSQDTSVWNPQEGWGATRAKHASEYYRPFWYPYATVRNDVEEYWEQFAQKITDLFDAPDVHQTRAEAIRSLNETRNCIRVGTLNISANDTPYNWGAVKEMCADYGLDFVGLQEVSNEYRVGDLYPSGLVSKTLPYVDDAPSRDTVTPWLENVILSRYPIQSAENVEFANLGGESRGYRKIVVKLPRYKDYYPDGDQYLSIYCTHLDLYVNRKLQAQELCEIMLADTNRFVVCVMDSNDFTATKDTWKVFTDAGFTQVHDGSSKTERTDGTFTASSSIDQIFVNSNINVVGYDIINTTAYTYKKTSTSLPSPISDHDLVMADLELDYGEIRYDPINSQVVPSTVYHVTRNMTHVKDNFVATNLAPNWHYQSTLTADDGYTISNVTVTMGGVDITASAYSNGALDFTVTGDVVITATATAS